MRHQIRFTLKKISRRLTEIEGLVYQYRKPIPRFLYRELDKPGLALDENTDLAADWKEIPSESYWAFPRTNFILVTNFSIPTDWKKGRLTALYLPIGIAGDFSHPEALVFINGKQYASCDRHHQEVILPAEFCDGQEHSLTLTGWTGIGGSTMGDMKNRLKMGSCEVVQIHPETRAFLTTSRVAAGIAKHLEPRDPAYHQLLTALDEAFKMIDLRLPIGESFYKSITKAHQCLLEGINKAGPALNVDITAVGHAHIDVAWLWTLAQTRQKSRRSFTNVLRLMEHYPSFSFTQSQPQLYDYLIEDDPEMFQEIKARVEEGRWEPIGGMWVEADCNISSGESLVRQFLLGREFFRDHFGPEAESPVLWLPDVFGYAWNLPQLIKEAGLEYFFTIKIGWSQYNRLPFDSFWWQGLDGTKVLTHFSTTKNPESAHASTYNADASPGQILGTWLNFQNKDDIPPGKTLPLLMSYGWGDGGGGPTREMVENILEMENFPSAPRVKPGKVIDFYHQLEAVSERLPVWNGELYLEFHRGTYTTQARNKRANRKMEFALHDAEFLAAAASLHNPGYQYPYDLLEKAWKLVCLNQFHDILPGSSIAPVYAESLIQYQEVEQITAEISKDALGSLSSRFGSDLVVNPTSFERDEPIMVDGELRGSGELLPYSITPLMEINHDPAPGKLICKKDLLENDYLRVEFNNAGDITSIFDKIALREVLPEGTTSNQWIAFEDRPLNWDAWDIDIFYDDKNWLAEPASSIKILEKGPLRGTLEIKRQILSSTYTQWISLDHNSARLDFDTEIDWQERKILLKAAFPVNVLSPTATYEIQWGNVERPTHQNTSWDWARFETAAQKWVDLSEGGYGVSLINDCKYGHDIHGNTIRLTLLRGTTAPDPEADLGKHTFKYSIFPHQCSWDENTVQQAYEVNDPLIIWKGKSAADASAKSFSLVSVDQPNLVIETVKKAQDGNGLIIRLYESQRSRGSYTIRTGFQVKKAFRTNILEEDQNSLNVEDNKITGSYKPYQIITLRVIPE
ncbi:MAG: alpha-mannosidase [Anaerolineales bacterium]|nr:alpha-mannosidase [Anaerolineales bacterium]